MCIHHKIKMIIGGKMRQELPVRKILVETVEICGNLMLEDSPSDPVDPCIIADFDICAYFINNLYMTSHGRPP